jgi:hypothetical protein
MTKESFYAKILKQEGWEYFSSTTSEYFKKFIVFSDKIEKTGGPYYNPCQGWSTPRASSFSINNYHWFRSPIEGVKLKEIEEIVSGQKLHKTEDKISFIEELLNYTEKEINVLRVLLKLSK